MTEQDLSLQVRALLSEYGASWLPRTNGDPEGHAGFIYVARFLTREETREFREKWVERWQGERP